MNGPGFGIPTFAPGGSVGKRDSGFARASWGEPVWLARHVQQFAALAALALLASACGGNNSGTAPSTTTGPTSENWSAVLAPGGTSSRSFTVNSDGTINVTMTSAGGTVGLGVGLPRVTGGGCRIGVQVITGPGPNPQISTPAEAGQYCVQVFDTGTLTDPIPINVKIDHP